MRKLFFWMMTTLALVIMMTSCSKISDNYVSAIPSDAVFVAKINVASMVKKSAEMSIPDIPDIRNIRDSIEAAIDNSPESVRAKLQEIKDNPDNSGIDFSKPIYFAVTSVSRSHAMVVAAVKDRKKLEELFKTLGEDTDDPSANMKLVKRGAFCEVETVGDFCKSAFGDNSVVISFNFDGKSAEDAVSLLSRDAGESILSDNKFDQLLGDGSDFAMYYDYGSLMKSVNTLTGNRSKADIFEGAIGTLSVNFEDGEILLKSKLDCDNEQYKQILSCVKPANGAFLSSIPADSYVAMQVGISDLMPMSAFIKDQMPKSQYDEANNALTQSFGMDIESIERSIGGDMAMFIAPQVGAEYPIFGMGIELKDVQLWKKIQELLDPLAEQSPEIEKSATGYVFNQAAALGSDYALSFDDGKLSFLPKNAPSQSFKSNPYAKTLDNGGVVIDIEGILANPSVKAFAQRGSKVAAFLSFCSSFKAITAQYQDPTKVQQARIIMANDKNALASLIDAGIDAFMNLQTN